MDQIQLVAFDMAGTTVRDRGEVQDCFMAAAMATGLQADSAQVNAMMGWSKRQVFETLWQAQIGDTHPDYEGQVKRSFQVDSLTELLDRLASL